VKWPVPSPKNGEAVRILRESRGGKVIDAGSDVRLAVAVQVGDADAYAFRPFFVTP
jgi:hypothetical protein